MAVDYVKEGRIAIMTINRPEAMNALNADVSREMREAMIDFRDNNDLWVAIITGAGDRAFSAGADIKDFRPATQEDMERVRDAAPVRADTIWKPFIAAINGYALGGGLEMAMTCDIRIAAEPSGNRCRDIVDWKSHNRSGSISNRSGEQGRATGQAYGYGKGNSQYHLQ